MFIYTITRPEAAIAIYAAEHRRKWGRWAAYMYCVRRGVPLGLYRLACQLEAAQKAGF